VELFFDLVVGEVVIQGRVGLVYDALWRDLNDAVSYGLYQLMVMRSKEYCPRELLKA